MKKKLLLLFSLIFAFSTSVMMASCQWLKPSDSQSNVTSESESSTPETSEPETSAPETSEPETSAPETSEPEEPTDPYVIYSYETEEERGFNIHNGGTTWFPEFKGEQGVRKSNEVKDGVMALRFDLGQTAFDFESITLRIYLKTDVDATVRAYNWYKPVGNLETNKWVDWTISVNDLMGDGTNLATYIGGEAADTYEEIKDLLFNQAWGYSDQVVCAFEFYDATISDIYISKISYTATEISEEPEDPEAPELPEEPAGLTAIYSYETEEERGFNIHNYGTTWLPEFKGEQGVRKSNKVKDGVMALRFDLGQTAFDFESITLRIYLKTDVDATVRAYNWYKPVGNLETNKWVDWTISVNDLMGDGTNLATYIGGEAADTYEEIKDLLFNQAWGYSDQVVCAFEFYDATISDIYISKISYTPKAAPEVTAD